MNYCQDNNKSCLKLINTNKTISFFVRIIKNAHDQIQFMIVLTHLSSAFCNTRVGRYGHFKNFYYTQHMDNGREKKGDTAH